MEQMVYDQSTGIEHRKVESPKFSWKPDESRNFKQVFGPFCSSVSLSLKLGARIHHQWFAMRIK